MRTEQILPDFIVPMLAVVVAYAVSAWLARRGSLKRDVHRSVWNFALLGLFLGCSCTGVLLAFRQLVSDLGPILRLHDQTGAGLLAAGAGHALERRSVFANKARAWWNGARKADNSWPQVLASLAALSAFLALPTVLLRLTAADAGAAAVAGSEARQPASAARPIPAKAGTTRDSRATPRAPDAVGTADRSPVRKPKASLREEVERVLAAGRGAVSPGGRSEDAVRFENLSGVPDGTIQEILRQVHDPELHINVYDLGLGREIAVDSQKNIEVAVVFTTPTCPNNGWLVGRMKSLLAGSGLFREVGIHEIPNAYWNSDYITEEGRRIFLEMGKW